MVLVIEQTLYNSLKREMSFKTQSSKVKSKNYIFLTEENPNNEIRNSNKIPNS
jgi:hypothetical protein